jgi:hypothetical protein
MLDIWTNFIVMGIICYTCSECFISICYAPNSITILMAAVAFCEFSPYIMLIGLLQRVPGNFAGDGVVSQH